MKKNAILIGIFLLLAFGNEIHSQELKSFGSYFFTGVNTSLGKKNNVGAYYGISPTDKFQALAILPYFRVHKNIHLMPGYMRMEIRGTDVIESTQDHFMPSVVFSFNIGKRFVLTDRNMYFRLSIKDQDDLSFYRNRIGLTYKTKIADKPAMFFVHDALFWSLDSGKFARNRLILGAGMHLSKWLSPQLWYVLQNEPGIFPRHQLYVILTVPLNNFGIFTKKKKDQPVPPPPHRVPEL